MHNLAVLSEKDSPADACALYRRAAAKVTPAFQPRLPMRRALRLIDQPHASFFFLLLNVCIAWL
jgi:hypothetical protein